MKEMGNGDWGGVFLREHLGWQDVPGRHHPGVLLGLALCVPTYIISVKRHYPKHERSSWKKRLEVTKDAIWALLMPVILLGGILSGIFYPHRSFHRDLRLLPDCGRVRL